MRLVIFLGSRKEAASILKFATSLPARERFNRLIATFLKDVLLTLRIIYVKIIIQESATKRYFAASGQWVTRPDSAEDFIRLLPAYDFAKRHLSGQFQIICHFPEDGYTPVIATGRGMA